MNPRRRAFFTAAPLLALPALALAEAKKAPEIVRQLKASDRPEWPMRVLQIEGRDGKVHEVPAWK